MNAAQRQRAPRAEGREALPPYSDRRKHTAALAPRQSGVARIYISQAGKRCWLYAIKDVECLPPALPCIAR
jgi:hypothetical protein